MTCKHLYNVRPYLNRIYVKYRLLVCVAKPDVLSPLDDMMNLVARYREVIMIPSWKSIIEERQMETSGAQISIMRV